MIFSALQSLAEFLPEQLGVLPGPRPAQVGPPLQHLPHAVERRQLKGGNLLQKHQDQHVLLLIKQTEAGCLDLSGAPLTLEVSATDHTDGLPASIDAIRNVVYDRSTWLKVSMVQTQSPALLSFQFWQQLSDYPWLIMVVVGDKGIILIRSLLVSMFCVKEQSQEVVVGVDQLPPQEMAGEGRHHEQEDYGCDGDKVDEVYAN